MFFTDLIFSGGSHVHYIDKVPWTVGTLCEKLSGMKKQDCTWTVSAHCEKLGGVEKEDFTQSHFRPKHIYPKVFPKTFCLRLGWLPQSRSKVKTLCP